MYLINFRKYLIRLASFISTPKSPYTFSATFLYDHLFLCKRRDVRTNPHIPHLNQEPTQLTHIDSNKQSM